MVDIFSLFLSVCTDYLPQCGFLHEHHVGGVVCEKTVNFCFEFNRYEARLMRRGRGVYHKFWLSNESEDNPNSTRLQLRKKFDKGWQKREEERFGNFIAFSSFITSALPQNFIRSTVPLNVNSKQKNSAHVIHFWWILPSIFNIRLTQKNS